MVEALVLCAKSNNKVTEIISLKSFQNLCKFHHLENKTPLISIAKSQKKAETSARDANILTLFRIAHRDIL